MAASPRWKVYGTNGEYMAACKYASDAAALVGCIGGEVRSTHSPKSVVWREGAEDFGASESWDAAAEIMERRAAS